MNGSSKRKAKVHRGFAIMTELNKFWNSSTWGYDPYLSNGEMTENDLKGLIAALKRMRAECRSAIEQLKELRE
jgi:hypothetical protein